MTAYIGWYGEGGDEKGMEMDEQTDRRWAYPYTL